MKEKITEDNCQEIRHQIKAGRSFSEVGEMYDVSASAIQHHAYGECSHSEKDVVDKTQSRVGIEECAELRKLFRDLDDADAVAEAADRGRGTVYHHVSGRCSHSEEAIEQINDHTLTKSQCLTNRVRYVFDPDVTKLAKECDMTRETIARHLSGDCSHPFAGVPVGKWNLHPYFWDVVAVMYHEHGANVEDLADVFGVSIKTIRGALAAFEPPTATEGTAEADD